MSHSTDDSDLNDDMKPLTLAKQFGCAITLIGPGVVMKWGSRVRPSEPEAMRLVQEHAPSVPLPTTFASWFGFSRDVAIGKLFMSFVPGERLDFYWDSFTDSDKERICHDIWGLVAKIRTIPRPADLQDKFCCAADGSPSLDPLLGAGNDPCPPIHDDTSLRNQIFARYEWAHTAPLALAFNSPIGLLPVADFYDGKNCLGDDEAVFALLLEEKGREDMVDCNIDLLSVAGMISVTGMVSWAFSEDFVKLW
ncbi:hypothetical protein C2857_006554 [Epichloe festucae Fl1]|uniref:Aminoglycoside phosphotransferase domain-containing protein n=1 Tax=Epichloe festucae (strain Fl1) TaxID=877507 RepID=A0A7S9KQA3_EPIFF|nr:hypothetical protein C2857_006554 [Epichloe festucae Fl1]